jgi:hypothetical protein
MSRKSKGAVGDPCSWHRFSPARPAVAAIGSVVLVLLLDIRPAGAAAQVVRLTSNGANQGETAIAVSGADDKVMVVAYNDARLINGVHGNMGYAYTTNGGAHARDWTRNLYIHGITKSDPDSLGWDRASDPILAYSQKDDTFKSIIIGIIKSSAIHQTAVVFASSSKTSKAPTEGLTWQKPVTVEPSLGTQLNPSSKDFCVGAWTDKPEIAVDNNSNSPHYGRVYIAWHERNCGNTDVQIWTSHHDVGVAGWSPAVQVSRPNGFNVNWGPSIRVGGAAGKVHVAWCAPAAFATGCTGQFAAAELVSSSGDGGDSWSLAVDAATIIMVPNTLPGHSFVENSQPVLSVDPTNGDDLRMVYANFHNFVDTDVSYVHSTDGGQTWSSPIVLGSGAHDQFQPHIAGSSDGAILWVCFYTDGFSYPLIDVDCAKSTDGVTFGTPVRASASSFDSGSQGWIGDYMANAVGADGGYRAAWSGDPASGQNLDPYFGRN